MTRIVISADDLARRRSAQSSAVTDLDWSRETSAPRQRAISSASSSSLPWPVAAAAMARSLLFYFPRMIEDLIRLCLGGGWVERLDFETLERVPERLLSKELVRREQDVLWRLKYLPEGKGEKGEAKDVVDPASRPRSYLEGEGEEIEYLKPEVEYFFVYLHLEHQSRPRVRMALDMAS